MVGETTVFRASRIITMNRYQPVASHVAVRDGRILGVGELDELAGWGDYRLDERFADQVLLPGFVEGHSHLMEGSMWRYPYVGYYKRTGPDGRDQGGATSIDEVVDLLRRFEADMADPEAPLIAWGFDPIYFGGRRMDKRDLDKVSDRRFVAVVHSNFHVMNANSALLDAAGITPAINVAGIVKDENGQPNGELQEMAAKFLALDTMGTDYFTEASEAPALHNFGRVACQTGVTCATDLYNALPEPAVENLLAATGAEDFRFRVVPAFGGSSMPAAEGAKRVSELKRRSTDKLIFGIVKLVTDGSIQGFTGRLKWPGYYNGAENGVWNVTPDELENVVDAYHQGGHQIFIHTNGDEASEVALDAVEAVLARTPRGDHRHTLQHCQMADEAQFRRMARLGLCVNLFANHIFYWGDQHRDITVGPDRAKRLDAAATAQRLGVPFAIHSDAPVTPLGPLFTAWCAVNRLTASGQVLGPEERISVADALYAITQGAAFTLKMDHQIGSIETGKWADFAVLDADPLAVPAAELKDVPIWGTVLGGRVFAARDDA